MAMTIKLAVVEIGAGWIKRRKRDLCGYDRFAGELPGLAGGCDQKAVRTAHHTGELLVDANFALDKRARVFEKAKVAPRVEIKPLQTLGLLVPKGALTLVAAGVRGIGNF